MTPENVKRLRLAITVVMAICTAIDGFLSTDDRTDQLPL